MGNLVSVFTGTVGPFPLFLPASWDVNVIAGAALAILDHEVNLEMEAIPSRVTRWKDLFFFLKILFIYFRQREREGEREEERHQCMLASHTSPTGDLTCNPGMCPDWELNQ